MTAPKDHMAWTARAGALLALCAATAVMAGTRPALAAPSCAGTLSGNLISPLPRPTSLQVHITDASAANIALGERFKDGLRAAGATIADNGQVTMEFASSITGLPVQSNTSGAVSPEFGQVGRLPLGPEPPVLTMSISLVDNREAQIDWVGYISCKIHSADMNVVAHDLGIAVGRSIGQNFAPRPL